MQPDKRKYAALLARKSPPSPLARDCLLAFVFGGAICTVGEGVRMPPRPPSPWCSSARC